MSGNASASGNEPSPELAALLMTWMASIAPVQEMVVGYRAQLLAQGITADAADAMSADVHRYFFQLLMRSIT